MRSMPINHRWLRRTLMLILCLHSLPSGAQALNLKTLLMPGPISEAHAEIEAECGQCHSVFEKASQASLCLTCHEEIQHDLTQRKGMHGRIDATQQECNNCHSEHLGRGAAIAKFDQSRFDHRKTDFELTGIHLDTDCSACHIRETPYREASHTCISCHESSDVHKTALGESCDDCHSPTNWIETKFDHADKGYLLNGNHLEAKCNACHLDEQYENTPNTCVSCHQLDDVHLGLNGNKCTDCHNESGWKEVKFDHDKDTNYPLRGQHSSLECNACHQQSVVDNFPEKTCIGCHMSDDAHQNTQGQECAECHSETSWSEVSFDHNRDTEFSLQGAHSSLQCVSCHRKSIKDIEPNQLATACSSCHAKNDVHAGQEGNQCQNCHIENNWREVRFNHDLSQFPLAGMHRVAACEGCHASNNFKNTESKCVDCHSEEDYHEQTLGDNCATCHNPNDWGLWLFDHNATSDFSLTGAHEQLNCSACHTRPIKNKIKQSEQCVSCHEADDIHNRSFGRNCERCHSTSDFKEIRVR